MQKNGGISPKETFGKFLGVELFYIYVDQVLVYLFLRVVGTLEETFVDELLVACVLGKQNWHLIIENHRWVLLKSVLA